MKRILFSITVLAALALILGGCTSSTDTSTTDTIGLEDFGPYQAVDESSADFGDPDIAEVLAENTEQEFDDPIAYLPVIDSIESRERPAVFCFRMVWGNLAGDSGVTDLTDWSGSLTLSRGAIVVTHVIRFEPGQDYLLPRYNEAGYYVPEELRWVSQTSSHFDGLATRLYIPPSITDEVVTVTYESEQYSTSFTIYELADLDTLIDIGAGNAISFQASPCEPRVNIPDRGHMIGRWGRDDDGQGIFYGRWMTLRGRIIGSVNGRWGVDSTGHRVFVGKYVDRQGRFEGFVKGTWHARGLGPNATGQFRGRIFNADREPIGVLKGHFKQGTTRKGGYFAGKWCVGNDCFSARW